MEYVVTAKRVAANILPEGLHRFVVTSVEEREGPNGPYWNYTCEVVDGPFKGKKVWHIVSLSESARWKMEDWLDAFSIPDDGELEVDGEFCVGETFRGKVIHEDFNDKLRAKLDSVLRDGKVSPSKPASPVKKKRPTKAVVVTQVEEDEEDEEDSSSNPSVKVAKTPPKKRGRPKKDVAHVHHPLPEESEAETVPVKKGKLPPQKGFKRPF